MTRVPAHMVRQAHHERGRDAQVKLQAQDGGGDPTWFVREIRVRELTEGNMYNGAEAHLRHPEDGGHAGGTVVGRRVKRLWALAGFGS